MSKFKLPTTSIASTKNLTSIVDSSQSKASSKVFGKSVAKRRNNYNDNIRIMLDNDQKQLTDYQIEQDGITFNYSNVTPFVATLMYCFDRAKALSKTINVDFLNMVFNIDVNDKNSLTALRNLLIFFMSPKQFMKIKEGKVTANLVRSMIFKCVTFTSSELALRISTSRGTKQTLEQYLDKTKDENRNKRSLGNNLIHGSSNSYAERFDYICGKENPKSLYSQINMVGIDLEKLASSFNVTNNSEELTSNLESEAKEDAKPVKAAKEVV